MTGSFRARVRAGAVGVAAAASVALITAGLAGPLPAQAAAPPTDHTCTVGSDAVPWPIQFGLDTDLPASVPVHSDLTGSLTTAVDIPADVADTMSTLNVAEFTATFRSTVSVGGVDVLTTSAPVARGVNPGGFRVRAGAPRAASAPATTGRVEVVGKKVAVTLRLKKADGTNVLPGDVVLDCLTPPGVIVDTVDVVPGLIATSAALSASPKPAKAGRRGAVTLLVKGATAAVPTGRATFQITGTAAGKRVNLTKRATLVRGKATVSLGTLKKGTLKIVGTYAGSSTHAASTAKRLTLRVRA